MRNRFVPAFVISLLLATVGLRAQTAQDYAADAERLVKALGLHDGSIVAEIGAGDGQLTIAIARAVGKNGLVYSTELSEAYQATIAHAVHEAGLHNVRVVPATETSANLPVPCCEAIVMRDVYHHFRDPAAMNASLLTSLCPGGRLAIIEFEPPPGGESADPRHRADDGHHGIMPATLERELTEAGFADVRTTVIEWRAFMVTARRAAEPSQGSHISPLVPCSAGDDENPSLLRTVLF